MHDVTLDYLQPAAGLAALSSGHVDAWDIWSPFIEEGEALDGATAIVTGHGVRQPVLVHRRVPRRARRPGQGRRHPRLPGAARAGSPVGQQPPVRLGRRLGQGHRPAARRHDQGGEPTTPRSPVPITPGRRRLRAAGRQRLHRQRADPRPRELQPSSSTPRSTPPPEPRHDNPHDKTAALQRVPDELRASRGRVAAAGERPVRQPRPRPLAQAGADRRARHVRLGVPGRRPGAVGQRRVPPGRRARADRAAHRAGRG